MKKKKKQFVSPFQLNNLTYGSVSKKNVLCFPSIMKIADKRDLSYAMLLANVEVC
jgi:hypothetical protein